MGRVLQGGENGSQGGRREVAGEVAEWGFDGEWEM